MKGTSKVIMVVTLVMVVTLAIVLGLILVLLAELYCSLLLRRRKLRKANSNTIPTTAAPAATTTTASPSLSHPPQHSPPPPPPLPPFTTSIYAQGVLQAPRSFLFPCTEQEPKKQQGNIHAQMQESIVSISPSPLSSFISRAPLKPVHHQELQGGSEGDEEVAACGGGGGEHLVYISNPIYENEEGEEASEEDNTPFETPDTSPSRLERSDSNSGDDDDGDAAAETEKQALSPIYTPPLTPMKKLPAEGGSVSLRDARSLGTSGSDSRSVNGPSSSSSGSPCTSPSW